MDKLKNLGVHLCVFGSAISFLLPVNVLAQGLNGSDYGPHEIFGRRTYVNGNSDAARWKTIQQVQSHLLGMNRKQVISALGAPDSVEGTFGYAITEDPISTAPKRWAQLSIVFENGKVTRFSIEATPR